MDWKILIMSLMCLDQTLRIEAEDLVFLVLLMVERKELIRDLLCDKYRLLENGYKLTFGCLVGGDLSGDRPTPFIFLVGAIYPCGV